jgi:propanol-preferring alcohol dehydrogenase
VVAVDKPTWLRVGDRVAINCHITCGACEHCLRGDLYFCDDLQILGDHQDGGFAEFVRVPESCCMILPDDISLEMGSLLVDMLGTSFRGVKRAELLPGDRVAIWGAGPIGLAALLVATRFGAQVAILDFNPYRLALAKEIGAALTINPAGDEVLATLLDWTRGRGLDVAFDCVGSEMAIRQALPIVKRRGKLVVVGVSYQLTLNPWQDLMCNELTILGTRNFVTSEFDEMIDLARRGLPVERVITHRFPLAEAEAAFALFRSEECGKILFSGGEG